MHYNPLNSLLARTVRDQETDTVRYQCHTKQYVWLAAWKHSTTAQWENVSHYLIGSNVLTSLNSQNRLTPALLHKLATRIALLLELNKMINIICLIEVAIFIKITEDSLCIRQKDWFERILRKQKIIVLLNDILVANMHLFTLFCLFSFSQPSSSYINHTSKRKKADYIYWLLTDFVFSRSRHFSIFFYSSSDLSFI